MDWQRPLAEDSDAPVGEHRHSHGFPATCALLVEGLHRLGRFPRRGRRLELRKCQDHVLPRCHATIVVAAAPDPVAAAPDPVAAGPGPDRATPPGQPDRWGIGRPGRRSGDWQLAGQEVARPCVRGRVTELGHGLRLDLADSFPGQVEVLAHLFQGPWLPTIEPETQP
jgi:hypothetical protein